MGVAVLTLVNPVEAEEVDPLYPMESRRLPNESNSSIRDEPKSLPELLPPRGGVVAVGGVTFTGDDVALEEVVAMDGSGVLSDDLCSTSDDAATVREDVSNFELRPDSTSSREASDAREFRLLLLPGN